MNIITNSAIKSTLTTSLIQGLQNSTEVTGADQNKNPSILNSTYGLSLFGQPALNKNNSFGTNYVRTDGLGAEYTATGNINGNNAERLFSTSNTLDIWQNSSNNKINAQSLESVSSKQITGVQDPKGMFGDGTPNLPFGGQWQNFKEYVNYWSSKGGFINQTGDYIDKAVMFKIHKRPEDAVVNKDTWMGLTEKLGFLFKEGEGSALMNKAANYAQEKLKAAGLEKLAESAPALAFVAANSVSKEALQGSLGQMLKADHDFEAKYAGSRSKAQERALHQEMHDITSKELEKAAKAEGLDNNHVLNNLQKLGHDKTQLSTLNYRAALETAKNWDLVSDPKAFAEKVKEHFKEHGFLPKFNLDIHHLMDARKGDTMAFADMIKDLEKGQQSALKGFGKDIGFSSDPNHANSLYFAVVGEKAASDVINQVNQALTEAGLRPEDILKTYGDTEATKLAKNTGLLSQTNFDFSAHGSENGTATNQAGISGTSERNRSKALLEEIDRNVLDLGNTDANIMQDLAKLHATFGGDKMVMNAHSCHGVRHGQGAIEKFAEGLAAYDKEHGTKSATEISLRGSDTFGTADAQGATDRGGYYTYKYGASGSPNLEFVYSGSSCAEVDTHNRAFHYDGSGSFDKNTAQQDAAKNAFYEKVKAETESTSEFISDRDKMNKEKEKDPL